MPNAPAHSSDAVFVVTYVEAVPSHNAAALDLLRHVRDANRADNGNLRCDLLQRLAPANHFVVLDVWQNDGAWTAQAARPRFEQLYEFLLSPCDVRVHDGFAVGPADGMLAEDRPDVTVFGVTHVDVVPPHKDEGVDLLAQLFEVAGTGDGNLGFDVLQQAGRPNHLTVVETWRDHAAFGTHAMTVPVRTFREKLAPLSGALYDQRLYRAVR